MGIAPDERHNTSMKTSSHHRHGFDFSPYSPAENRACRADQRRRCLSPAHKKPNQKQQKRGEFFAARPAGSIFGNSGMSGSPSFGYFSWRGKKSD